MPKSSAHKSLPTNPNPDDSGRFEDAFSAFHESPAAAVPAAPQPQRDPVTGRPSANSEPNQSDTHHLDFPNEEDAFTCFMPPVPEHGRTMPNGKSPAAALAPLLTDFMPDSRPNRHLVKRSGGLVRPSGTCRSMSGKLRAAREKSLSIAAALVSGAADPNFSEFEEILSRMVDRIVKLLQAEKCVFLLHDASRAELQAVSPARGFSGEALSELTCPVRAKTLSAWVFRHGESIILDPTAIQSDPRSVVERLASGHHLRSSLSVPLYIELRDTQNNVVSRDAIGVVHVFNKHEGGGFTLEDQALLEAMSRSAASIFNSARAFREVVTEKQELIQTLDSLYVGLMMVGLDGRIIQINPAARTVFGIRDDESVVGLRYEATVRNDSFRAVLDKALCGLDPVEVTGEVTVKAGTEERIYQAHCAPIKNQDQNSVVGLLILLSDITEIRGVDRMKTAFISTVSHELRTPLTSIKGFVATLLDDTEGFYTADDQREFYRIIDTECDRLTRLIDDLLNVSRIEQGTAMQLNLQTVDIPSIVENVLATQRAYATPDRHNLRQEFPKDFPVIQADPDKIGQILTNLVNNAIKYSPQGGPVLVTGGLLDDTGYIYVSVCDHGLGIPREHIKKVFDRFHRVDNRDNREIGGTGIGLFLVKSLVEAHHGNVKVESEFGRGSVFTLTLPIQQPDTGRSIPRQNRF